MTDRPQVDLSRFDNSKTFHPGAGALKRTLWYLTNAIFFLNPCFPFRNPKPGLLRLFGADAVIFPNHGGRFSYTPETCKAIANCARAPIRDARPALPV
ncbi:MAG TPA: hypothetical protein PKJ19_13365, partial [Flavobacteriales bacterium]|nr:hypothetical protein [Flavobacteriales bacterium]